MEMWFLGVNVEAWYSEYGVRALNVNALLKFKLRW